MEWQGEILIGSLLPDHTGIPHGECVLLGEMNYRGYAKRYLPVTVMPLQISPENIP